MQITGLQVYSPTYGWHALTVGEKVTLKAGETLQVGIAVPYKGKAQDFTLYGAIGSRNKLLIPIVDINWFDEMLFGRDPLPCPKSETEFTTVEGSVGILVPTNTPSVTNYDLYVKIEEQPSVMDEVDDFIDIVAPPSIFEMIGPLLVLGLMVGMVSMMAPIMEEGL